MSWGAKITVVFSLFVAGILVMVFKASRQNIDLVVPDYYEQELKYQGRIDEIKRTALLSGKVECEVKEGKVEIRLPKEMQAQHIEAAAWLYCVADQGKDIEKKLSTENGMLSLPFGPYNRGLHEVKLQWTAADRQTYYFEQKIFIQ